MDTELRRRGHRVAESVPVVPVVLKSTTELDGYGPSDSLCVTGDEPEYVNMEEIRLQQSTRL